MASLESSGFSSFFDLRISPPNPGKLVLSCFMLLFGGLSVFEVNSWTMLCGMEY